jgi:(E)-4-hydroxy-3-methylbut-2-enyl-diphosphate synthase
MPAPVRILTAVPICDGHDSAVNTINLEFIRHGIEVIYLGFHRYVGDIVRAAIQEDVAAIGISSYNGGHIDFFADVVRQLRKRGADDIAVFGGGGGTITHRDAAIMRRKGIDQIFFAGTPLGEMVDYVRDKYGKRRKRSVTNDPELKLARKLTEIEEVRAIGKRQTPNAERRTPNIELPYDPFSYQRRASERIERDGVRLGGEELIRVVVRQANYEKIAHKIDKMGDYKPEIVYENADVVELDPRDEAAIEKLKTRPEPQFVTVKDDVDLPGIAAFRLLAARLQARHPILLKDVLRHSERSEAKRNAVEEARGRTSPITRRDPSTPLRSAQDDSTEFLHTLLVASTNIGSLLCDGIGDAILVQGEEAPGQALRLSYNILQAAGSRIFKTDYVACPSCGRTLFNLQTTTAKIKAATSHLKGVKIAIMGCIVNGPGEMADADFGYVGGAPGKVNLYVGKTPVKFNIPEAEAVERLQDLIREHGKWIDPAPAQPVLV